MVKVPPASTELGPEVSYYPKNSYVLAFFLPSQSTSIKLGKIFPHNFHVCMLYHLSLLCNNILEVAGQQLAWQKQAALINLKSSSLDTLIKII